MAALAYVECSLTLQNELAISLSKPFQNGVIFVRIVEALAQLSFCLRDKAELKSF